MTETASQVAATPPDSQPVGSGIPLPHAEIRISAQGEILVKAESNALGVLVQDALAPVTDEEGWLHTKDVGHVEDGVLFVDGRMDLQFISGGENIQPEVIERALVTLTDVTEAVVVPKEDVEFGHRPLAWVDAEVTDDRIRRWNHELRASLPGYMIPVEYRQLPPLEGLKRKRGELVI
jgi:O-succinylbenzoic acid--CoA ligase